MHKLVLASQVLGVVALVAFIWLVVRAFKTRICWGSAVLLLPPITATLDAVEDWDEAKKPFLLFMTTFFASAAIGLYVFTAWGGWKSVQAAYRVKEGIQQQTLTEEDTKGFMRSNLDFLEKASQSEQDRQKVAVMRKVLERSESGFTQEEQREISKDFRKLTGQPDPNQEERQQLQPIRRSPGQPESKAVPIKQERTSPQNLAARTREKAAAPENQKATERRPEGPHYKDISPDQAGDYFGAPVILTRRNGLEQKCTLIGVSGRTLRCEQRIGRRKISFQYHHTQIKSMKVLVN